MAHRHQKSWCLPCSWGHTHPTLSSQRDMWMFSRREKRSITLHIPPGSRHLPPRVPVGTSTSAPQPCPTAPLGPQTNRGDRMGWMIRVCSRDRGTLGLQELLSPPSPIPPTGGPKFLCPPSLWSQIPLIKALKPFNK